MLRVLALVFLNIILGIGPVSPMGGYGFALPGGGGGGGINRFSSQLLTNATQVNMARQATQSLRALGVTSAGTTGPAPAPAPAAQSGATDTTTTATTGAASGGAAGVAAPSNTAGIKQNSETTGLIGPMGDLVAAPPPAAMSAPVAAAPAQPPIVLLGPAVTPLERVVPTEPPILRVPADLLVAQRTTPALNLFPEPTHRAPLPGPTPVPVADEIPLGARITTGVVAVVGAGAAVFGVGGAAVGTTAAIATFTPVVAPVVAATATAVATTATAAATATAVTVGETAVIVAGGITAGPVIAISLATAAATAAVIGGIVWLVKRFNGPPMPAMPPVLAVPHIAPPVPAPVQVQAPVHIQAPAPAPIHIPVPVQAPIPVPAPAPMPIPAPAAIPVQAAQIRMAEPGIIPLVVQPVPVPAPPVIAPSVEAPNLPVTRAPDAVITEGNEKGVGDGDGKPRKKRRLIDRIGRESLNRARGSDSDSSGDDKLGAIRLAVAAARGGAGGALRAAVSEGADRLARAAARRMATDEPMGRLGGGGAGVGGGGGSGGGSGSGGGGGAVARGIKRGAVEAGHGEAGPSLLGRGAGADAGSAAGGDGKVARIDATVASGSGGGGAGGAGATAEELLSTAEVRKMLQFEREAQFHQHREALSAQIKKSAELKDYVPREGVTLPVRIPAKTCESFSFKASEPLARIMGRKWVGDGKIEAFDGGFKTEQIFDRCETILRGGRKVIRDLKIERQFRYPALKTDSKNKYYGKRVANFEERIQYVNEDGNIEWADTLNKHLEIE